MSPAKLGDRLKRLIAIVALTGLAACTTMEPPSPTPTAERAVPTPAPPPSTADEAGDPTARLATLKVGASRFADVERLLGAPNETETDKTPCGGACMKTTVTWTYYQVKNGRSNALSSSRPVTLVFDSDGMLLEIGGAWRSIHAAR